MEVAQLQEETKKSNDQLAAYKEKLTAYVLSILLPRNTN